MEDINKVINDNMKFYTADTIRKMMPYSSYTAEDFVRKIIVPEIVSTALQDGYYYDFDLKGSPWRNPKRLKDIIEVLIELGFDASHNECESVAIPINELHISWAKKKESDKNE